MNTPLDVSELRARFGGRVELLRRIIKIFSEQTPKLVAVVREAERTGDAGSLERAAHTLRGSLLQFGAQSLGELAHRLEKEAGKGELADLKPVIEQIDRESTEVVQFLTRLSESPDL